MPVDRISMFSRRRFLQNTTGAMLASGWGALTMADDRPPVSEPKSTAGDRKVEPNWQQRVEISVGPDPANCDIAGLNDRAIQAAVDMVAAQGGGTVRVAPGTYRLRNAVYRGDRWQRC